MCAAGILVRHDTILLAKRSQTNPFYPGVWDIIGGHCKEGETPEQTLAREFEEEVGVTPLVFTQVAILYDPEPEHQDYVYTVYVVTEWTGSPENLAPHEHSEIGWIDINDAVSLNLAHPDYPALFTSVRSFMRK